MECSWYTPTQPRPTSLIHEQDPPNKMGKKTKVNQLKFENPGGVYMACLGLLIEGIINENVYLELKFIRYVRI